MVPILHLPQNYWKLLGIKMLYVKDNFCAIDKYSIICLFRIAVGPDEKFGLDRIRITEGFMFQLRDIREMLTDQF